MKKKELTYKQIREIRADIPEGTKGDWKIELFVVDKEGADHHNMQCAMHGGRRTIVEGTYTRLKKNGSIIMSDTPAEQDDHMEFIQRAKGDVLINGLGMGWVIEVLLRLPQVTSLTVIEISQNLIDLVAPHYKAKDKENKLNIICADAFEWKPPKGQRYGAVWHDIWDNICGDNVEDMKKLHRKYGRRTDYQSSWCRWECEQKNKVNYNYGW